MSAIDDLIAQIEDKVLRERLKVEADRITKEKKFGLVFEEHLPELTPLFSAEIRPGSRVAKKNGDLTELWRVLSISEGQAVCIHHRSGEKIKFPIDEIMAVANFGEPIFPALTPVHRVQNGPSDVPWHTLIEADNYHALQLLEYLYTGQVDCIYIDPPYNTGARDWKYNNDYVDSNDSWRHSKWLAFMHRRLRLAKNLLKPKIGVLIVTIDEHEVNHLGMMLEHEFPEYYRQMVTCVVNRKGVTQGRFSRVEEYLFFCFGPEAYVKGIDDDLLLPYDPNEQNRGPQWKSLLRAGEDSQREDRERMFYPVIIDPKRHAVVGVGNYLPLGQVPNYDLIIDGLPVVWPIRSDGSHGRWAIGIETLQGLIGKGFVSLGRYMRARNAWSISYLTENVRSQIKRGILRIVDYDKLRNRVSLEYVSGRERQIKTVWNRTQHDAGSHGTNLLTNILDQRCFAYPKSIYSTRDAISSVMRDRPHGLILDFFAGSGTTLNAVNLLNAEDGGQRRCIMVTNNEVSENEAKALRDKGLLPGDSEWEKHGVCQAITWPRSKYTILGHRGDGTEIGGEYFTGNFAEKEKPRNFYHIDFASNAEFTTAARKKRFVRIIDGIPQSIVKPDSAFILSDNEKHFASVLFDDTQVDAWLDAMIDHDHITDFY
ncbi:MAG: site-specific DNA-methyltransferase, partial [Firmicutes bacterium]|nr:site-specific DNA-methyltransferase [Bacillota bacterium]